MKIAYLILCHDDPMFVRRVSVKLTEKTENHVFIHVDAKQSILEFTECLGELKNIHLLKSRIPVFWGGMNSIRATVKLFEASCMREEKFDRYVLLQGHDYPIKNNEEIEDFFKSHMDIEFIKAISETWSSDNKILGRYILKWHKDSSSTFAKAYNRVNFEIEKHWPLKFPNPKVKIDGKNCEIFRGWAQIALTDKAVRYILDFYKSHPKYNEFFQHVYAADESYFHTIIYNSPFRKYTADKGEVVEEKDRCVETLLNLTYFEYPGQVRIFTKKEEFEFLRSKADYLFFRKASSKSEELLNCIDWYHENELSSNSN